MEITTIIPKITSYFTPEKDVKTVYLFGSIAKNCSRESSDLDLAVLFPPGIEPYTRFDNKLTFACELEDLTGMPVDIVDLQEADLFFIHQIMKEKIIIVDHDPAYRVEFEVKYRREFFDRQPFYELYHQQALSRIGRKV